MAIKKIGVVGAGTMGSGIAQLFVQNGFETLLFDVSTQILEKAEERILKGLERVKKEPAISLLKKTVRLEDFFSCDFAIEAAIEDLKVKQDLFRRLDRLLPPPKILATNTSSLPVSQIASVAEHPERIAGLHFFNPAPMMRLVEIIRADSASESTLQVVAELARKLGKTAVLCKDTPGFIANRVTRPFYFEGMKLLESGAGSPLEIDGAMRDPGKFKMGPFELMDLIGLDVNLSISKIVYGALGLPDRLKSCRVQEVLVARGCLGRKNFRGFYIYDAQKPPVVNPLLNEIVPQMGSRPLEATVILRTILEGVIAEAKKSAQEGVATPQDIDTAMTLGMNWPKGPFAWEAELSALKRP